MPPARLSSEFAAAGRRVVVVRRSYVALLAALIIAAGSQAAGAGEFNPVLNYHDPAPVWKELPGVDGKPHSLADFADKEVVVVAFTCNSCPYAVDYEDRLNAFARKHAGGDSRVGVVAINVNQIEADSLANMKQRAEEKGFQFPYLFDQSQQIARQFGALRTPEFFVLDRQRRVVYMGAWDNSADPRKVTQQYVEPAVEAALENKRPAPHETVPVGCLIRFARSRKP